MSRAQDPIYYSNMNLHWYYFFHKKGIGQKTEKKPYLVASFHLAQRLAPTGCLLRELVRKTTEESRRVILHLCCLDTKNHPLLAARAGNLAAAATAEMQAAAFS